MNAASICRNQITLLFDEDVNVITDKLFLLFLEIPSLQQNESNKNNVHFEQSENDAL